MRKAQLGEFLTPVRDEVPLEPDVVYPTASTEMR